MKLIADIAQLDLNSRLNRQEELSGLLVDLAGRFKAEATAHSQPQPIASVAYGTKPLLISAPHATPHNRQGAVKKHEAMTGVLALVLAKVLGCSVILPTAIQNDDPNFDTNDNAPYKSKLASLLKDRPRLVDLHGMKDGWGSDICIGVGQSADAGTKDLIAHLKEAAQELDLAVTVNQPFDSLHPGTISQFARTRGCLAAQLEISRDCRTQERLPQTFLTLYAALDRWLATA